ncbi:DUF3106 domain-containing protein [Schlegelella aquatica]|uniref:DUF3106 domain-containing protein n=1 Tax=Caldimonas aquatica TaxID=376175 RepID=UPI003753DD23
MSACLHRRLIAGVRAGACAFVLAGAVAWPQWAAGQSPSSTTAPSAASPSREGPSWKQLSPAQQAVLRPLERDWPSIDAARKRKWLEIAARYPSMSADEQQRLQARMAEWARMSTEERRDARLNFREVRELSPDERRGRWEAYQSLSEEERQRLAARAQQATKKPTPRDANPGGKAPAPSAGSAAGPRPGATPKNASGNVAKSNIVPIPATGTPPKPVAPVLVKGGPGATTTFITKKPTPPWHQQPGLPKIAATPEFVDPHTLLPRVGPQGVAAVPAPSDDAAAR